MSETQYIEILPEGESTLTEPVKILREVLSLQSEATENRRWFHSHPELSFQETNTALKVAELLRSYGITEVFEGVGRVRKHTV